MKVILNNINLKRIKGFLDLDDYFYNSLQRPYIDEEDLFLNGLVDVEIAGKDDKFWIIDPITSQKIVLFKKNGYRSNELYGELFSEEMAKLLGFSTAHYDLATFKGYKGSISYNFMKEDDHYYSGFDLIADFYENRLQKDNELCNLFGINPKNIPLGEAVVLLNNIKDVEIILQDKYKNNPNKIKIVSSIINGLKNSLILDILSLNNDNHCDNWGILNDQKLSPNFDRGRIFNMQHKIDDDFDLFMDELKLMYNRDDDGNYFKVLHSLLESNEEVYIRRLSRKAKILSDNINLIISNVEQKIEDKLPKEIEEYFIDTAMEHLQDVKKEISKTKKKIYN